MRILLIIALLTGCRAPEPTLVRWPGNGQRIESLPETPGEVRQDLLRLRRAVEANGRSQGVRQPLVLVWKDL